MPDKTKKEHTLTNDQNFKNLILDYPRQYAEFIDLYAKLDEADVTRYREEYLPKSPRKGLIELGRKQ
jgi:hypothetical protein